MSIAAIIMMAVISPSGFSQITTNELPVSFNLNEIKDPPIPIFVDPPDMDKIRAEDAANDTIVGGIQRIAVPININTNTDSDGQWEKLSDGSVLWRISFIASGADALFLTYDRFWLPEGGKLFVYGQDNSDVIGAVTHEYLQGDQDNPAPFTTGIISGDAITVEYFAPSYVISKPIISIENIYYGYRNISKYGLKDFGDSGNCQVNINCSEGQNWQDEKRAVARILLTFPDGVGWCSGALINNTSENFSPYLLTANHCLRNYYDAVSNASAPNLIFYWDYEFSGCDNQSTQPTIKQTIGATIVANNSISDFALLQLTQNPRNLTNFNPYYLGWDRSGSTGGSCGVGIHHPMGDVKKIATHNLTPVNSNCYNNNYWKISNWSQTSNGWSVTEAGSSGSPLLNNNHHLIGQLRGAGTCSNENCLNPARDVANYGKFSVSWTGNGATDNRRRLNHWLDPAGTNPGTLNGISLYRISGPSIVCSSGASFTVNNLPTGATITWSQGPYLTRTSAQGANPCIFSSTGSGSSWIRATLVIGSNTITLTDKVVWSGVPQVTVTGPSVGYIGGSYTYYANTAPGAQITSYQWTLTPPYDGNNIYGYGYWANTSFNNPNGGYFQIGCTVSNNCGSGIMGTTYISISETKNDYIVSPNPASTIITISVVPAVPGAKGLTDFNAVYDVSIHDMNGVLQGRKEYSGDCFTIPVDNLKDGNYLIRIDNGKFVSVKQVIIKR
jgi:S1-C subfamily serine protease